MNWFRIGEAYRLAGRWIVFTNGCFDLLDVGYTQIPARRATLHVTDGNAERSDVRSGRLPPHTHGKRMLKAASVRI